MPRTPISRVRPTTSGACLALPSADSIREFILPSADIIRCKSLSGDEYAKKLEIEAHLAQSGKTLSATAETSGGAIVAPAGQPKTFRSRKSILNSKQSRDLRTLYRNSSVFADRLTAAKYLASHWASLEPRYGRTKAFELAQRLLDGIPLPDSLGVIVDAAKAMQTI